MNLGINNNTSFGARVKFNIEQTKGVWQEVAQTVEKKTKAYPNETISIDLNSNNHLDSVCISSSDRLFYMDPTGANEMAKLTPKQIAQKIVKLFNVTKYEDSISEQYDIFINKILKLDSKFKMSDSNFERFEDDLFGALYEKKSDTVTETLNQDPILKFIINK